METVLHFFISARNITRKTGVNLTQSALKKIQNEEMFYWLGKRTGGGLSGIQGDQNLTSMQRTTVTITVAENLHELVMSQ